MLRPLSMEAMTQVGVAIQVLPFRRPVPFLAQVGKEGFNLFLGKHLSPLEGDIPDCQRLQRADRTKIVLGVEPVKA